MWIVWTKEATLITRIKRAEQKMISRQLPLHECIVVLATALLQSDCSLSSSTTSSFNPDVCVPLLLVLPDLPGFGE